MFDKQLSFLTDQDRRGHEAGYEYATLRFSITAFNQADNEKLKTTIGNFLRRFVWEEDHAASLVLTVTKSLPKAGTDVVEEMTIAEIPVFSVVYDEKGVPTENTIVDTGRQIIPWFRVAPNERINFSYTVKASQDVRSELADKIVTLSETSATLIGSSGAWILNELTAPHISDLTDDIDKELNESFSFVRNSTRKIELGVLTDDQDRYAVEITISDENEAVAAKVHVGLVFRPTRLSDTWEEATRVPKIEQSPVTIKGLRVGVRGDQNLKWLIENENEAWYSNWTTTSDYKEFSKGCKSLLEVLQNTAELGYYDAAAGMWAELIGHEGYLQTAAFHDGDCLDPALKDRLMKLGMQIPRPADVIAASPERNLTIKERDKALRSMVALMSSSMPQGHAETFLEQVFEKRVRLHDPDDLLRFNSMVEVDREYAIRALRSLGVEKAGCNISSVQENAAARRFVAVHTVDGETRMLQIEVLFSRKGVAEVLPPVTDVKVLKTSAEDEFIKYIRKDRGVFPDDHERAGEERGCGDDNDWYPWNETT
ncbi:hypothetical protein [Thalassospira xiamenensis]|uniref:hypothetical protein n=1 Tax=Thalassospira xiamenensis TaxID=220697 RepID=UPI003AA883E1